MLMTVLVNASSYMFLCPVYLCSKNGNNLLKRRKSSFPLHMYFSLQFTILFISYDINIGFQELRCLQIQKLCEKSEVRVLGKSRNWGSQHLSSIICNKWGFLTLKISAMNKEFTCYFLWHWTSKQWNTTCKCFYVLTILYSLMF